MLKLQNPPQNKTYRSRLDTELQEQENNLLASHQQQLKDQELLFKHKLELLEKNFENERKIYEDTIQKGVEELEDENSKIEGLQGQIHEMEKANFELLKHSDGQKVKIKALLDENANVMEEKVGVIG